MECLFSFIGAIIWIAAASGVFYAIVAQSAVGADKIDDWPSLTFYHAISEMLPLGAAVIATGR
jgi:hypothetical protein